MIKVVELIDQNHRNIPPIYAVMKSYLNKLELLHAKWE